VSLKQVSVYGRLLSQSVSMEDTWYREGVPLTDLCVSKIQGIVRCPFNMPVCVEDCRESVQLTDLCVKDTWYQRGMFL
jgi:hypothetical protein